MGPLTEPDEASEEPGPRAVQPSQEQQEMEPEMKQQCGSKASTQEIRPEMGLETGTPAASLGQGPTAPG